MPRTRAPAPRPSTPTALGRYLTLVRRARRPADVPRLPQPGSPTCSTPAPRPAPRASGNKRYAGSRPGSPPAASLAPIRSAGMKAPKCPPALGRPTHRCRAPRPPRTCTVPDSDPAPVRERLHHRPRRGHHPADVRDRHPLRRAHRPQSPTTSTSPRGWSPSDAARADRAGPSRSAATAARCWTYLAVRTQHPLADRHRPLARRTWQAVRPRAASVAPCAGAPSAPDHQASGRTGSATPPPTAGSPPGLRIRPHGHRRMDPHRHAGALHPRPSLRTSRGRGVAPRPRQPLTTCRH